MTIPESLIPYLNIVFIIIIALYMINGYRKGFVSQVFGLLAILTAILVSWYFTPILAERISLYPHSMTPFSNLALSSTFYNELNSLLWHVILFAGGLVIMLIIRPLVKSLSELPGLGIVNRILGALTAVVPAFLLLIMLAFFISTPLVKNGGEVLDSTMLGTVRNISENTVTLLKEPYLVQQALQKVMNNEPLNQQEATELWKWLISKDADPDEARQFIQSHSTNVNLPAEEEK